LKWDRIKGGLDSGPVLHVISRGLSSGALFQYNNECTPNN